MELEVPAQQVSAVPWLVAESVLLHLVRLHPRSLVLTRDPGDRILRHLVAADPDEEVAGEVLASCATARASCVVWVGTGTAASSTARSEVLDWASRCDHDLLLCEPVVPGFGIGLPTLRALDPDVADIPTDEVADGPDRTRERKPWEAKARWAIAHVYPWRFAPEAEAVRQGILDRLSGWTLKQACTAIDEVLQRYPRAQELWLLALVEFCRRRDREGAQALLERLRASDHVANSMVARGRTVLLDGWSRAATGPRILSRTGT